jgi:hypothetical protein
VTTSWTWLTECQECAKLSSRQRVATLKNLKYKIYFDLFNSFVITTRCHMCNFKYLMSSLLFYNVENSKNKALEWVVGSKRLTGTVCAFWPVAQGVFQGEGLCLYPPVSAHYGLHSGLVPLGPTNKESCQDKGIMQGHHNVTLAIHMCMCPQYVFKWSVNIYDRKRQIIINDIIDYCAVDRNPYEFL